ncbi:MAG: glycosyltransferase [Acidobacteriia bacterium]|nr:glycosyltransferase [Terriglobia bacterium]
MNNLRTASRWAPPRAWVGQSLLAVVAAVMAGTATCTIPDGLSRLGAGAAGRLEGRDGTTDLAARQLEVQHWFAGAPVWSDSTRAAYPAGSPASNVVLWPVLGWMPLGPALGIWTATSVAALAWICVLLVRQTRPGNPLLCLLAALLPLSLYSTGTCLANGQLALPVLPMLIAGLLLLDGEDHGWRRDLAGSALILVALVEPSVAVPFLLVVLLRLRRLRPVSLIGGGYFALTAAAVLLRPGSPGESLGGWLAHAASLLTSPRGYASLPAWLLGAGLGAWVAPASLLVLGTLAVWFYHHRDADLWTVLGFTGIVARIWTYHGSSDDLLILLPMVTLARLATDREAPRTRRVPATVFLFLTWLTMVDLQWYRGLEHIPYWPDAKGILWLAVLVFLARQPARQAGPSAPRPEIAHSPSPLTHHTAPTPGLVSIVVPTYNEAEGLPLLVGRVCSSLRAHSIEAELIIVDDSSPDGTGDLADRLAQRYPVRVLRRPKKLGLASAVLDGWALARGDIIGVMDADLSHEAEAIPLLVAAVRDRGVELAVGSRHVPGSGTHGWPATRKFASWAANKLARPFTPVRDATSGFIFMRRSVLDGVALDARGFKIGLEIMAKGRYTRWEEVPYVFTDRRIGASKLGTREVVDYLHQLAGFAMTRLRKRWHPRDEDGAAGSARAHAAGRPAQPTPRLPGARAVSGGWIGSLSTSLGSASRRLQHSFPGVAANLGSNPWLWPILATFAAIQIGIVFLAANGAFFDEGIYAVAGLRVLEGRGVSDGYLGWFNGSPFVWPPCAAVGHQLGGLAGARLVAVLFAVVGLTAFAKSVEALFGKSAARWGTLALGCNGFFLALAHFAVYDVVALAGLAVSVWLIARGSDDARQRWSVFAALAFAVAVIAKYGYAFMGVPLSALIVSLRPRRRVFRELLLFAGIAGLVVAGYFLLAFGVPWPKSASSYLNQTFRTTPQGTARMHLVYAAVPLLLAVCGGIGAWKKHSRLLVLTCLGSLLVWPAFHLWSLNFVGASKHVVAGFFFSYLLAGVGLDRLWNSRARWGVPAVVAVMLTWGGLQWYWQEHSWRDHRPAESYLLSNMKPGEKLVAEASWTFVLDLYSHRVIASPFEVIGPNRRPGSNILDTCTAEWLVDDGDRGGRVAVAAARCGYRLVVSSTSPVFDPSRFWPARRDQPVKLYRLATR